MMMGTYFKTHKIVRGYPVYEQNVNNNSTKQFLFVGPLGNWRVGPDTSTYIGSGLTNSKRSPSPPKNGWKVQHQGIWFEDVTLRAELKSMGKRSVLLLLVNYVFN